MKVFLCKLPTPLQITVLTPQQNVQVQSLYFLQAYCESHYRQVYMVQNSSATSAFWSLICNIQGKWLKRNYVYYSICMFIHCNIILHSFWYYTSQTSQNSMTRITTQIQHNLHNENFRDIWMFLLYITQVLFLVSTTHDIPQWHQVSLVTNV